MPDPHDLPPVWPNAPLPDLPAPNPKHVAARLLDIIDNAFAAFERDINSADLDATQLAAYDTAMDALVQAGGRMDEFWHTLWTAPKVRTWRA